MNCNEEKDTLITRIPGDDQSGRPSHEITLTDKLNKKLLQSFLKKINETNNPFNNLSVNNQNNSTSNQ